MVKGRSTNKASGRVNVNVFIVKNLKQGVWNKMITVHIPKGGQMPQLGKEIMSAKNIKDRSTRVVTLQGL